jgi:acetoin utilization protein AcuB
MRTHKIRHLPVLDGVELVGVVTDRDVRGLAADVRIDAVMSATPYTVSPTTPLEVAARHMARHKLGSCVVMEANEVIGMLTTTDGMRALAELLDVAEQLPPRLERAAAPAATPVKRERR